MLEWHEMESWNKSNPLVAMLLRHGYKQEEDCVFWYKHIKTKRGNCVTMYVTFMFLQTANELSLFRKLKDNEMRANKYKG